MHKEGKGSQDGVLYVDDVCLIAIKSCFIVSSIHILVNLLLKKHYLYHDIQTQLHLVK